MEPLNVFMFTSVFLYSKLNAMTNETELFGADAEVLRVLQSRFNVSLTFQEHMELTATTLDFRTFDMTAVGCFIRQYGLYDRVIRFSTCVDIDRLCFVVPKAQRYPAALLPLLVFDPVVWLCFFVVCVLTALCWMVVHRIKRRGERVRQGLIKYTLQTVQVLFGEPLPVLPTAIAERILIVILFMCSIVLITEFVTFLTIICLSPIYYKDISSIAELMASTLPIVVQTEFYKDDVLLSVNNEPTLPNRIAYVNTTERMTQSIGEGARHLATVEREDSFHLDLQPWALAQKLQFVNECPRMYFVAYAFSRQCAACAKVDRLLGRLLNGGFIEKWIADMRFNKTMEDWPIYLAIEEARQGSDHFRLHDVLFAFVALGLGHLLAIVVFAVEMWSAKSETRAKIRCKSNI